ncbi:leucine carboxyl methyltransferase 2-like protein [Dinothrombium tinctorium]|uniref:tRNA wybutosine-synthesizing protein 4 n=1 Tax=Dinothrombium tinctorium TaxID=1965070 RepID=A0A3S4QMF2_9ACAR|nr:leucine carboxyl methyltransferase 2-like protein [Dinothrombium tinctorium]RWS05339.1 leucine carboxyl methyltransferase 2-like protein [Dinothrombium tinctorium]RWS15309.1 leucine carboxyl methyltransferase 2-like protein [Dinothrombium tinctorium]
MNSNLVQTTNDCSIASKASMNRKAYVSDPYLDYFVPKCRRRSPLINRGYYLRYKAVEWALNNFANCSTIISLGSGFDTLPFRRKNFNLIEIDFMEVANKKAEIITSNNLLSQSANNHNHSVSSNILFENDCYCLIGADLRDSSTVCDLLNGIRLLEHNQCKAITILNECSLCYLQEEESNLLLSKLLNLFPDRLVVYISYEMMKSDESNDAFSQIMMKHFETIGSPLKTFITRERIMNRFTKIGFQNTQIIDMLKFWSSILSKEEKQRINGIEVFDEYEEFDLLCSNYALTVAIKSIDYNDNTLHLSSSNESNLTCGNSKICNDRNFTSKKVFKSLHRFSHSVCHNGGANVYVFGGFGFGSNDANKHKRLSNLINFDTETNSANECFVDGHIECRMHCQLTALTDKFLFVSGGRSSPTNAISSVLLRKLDDINFRVEQYLNSFEPPPTWRHTVTPLNSHILIQIGGKIVKEHYFHIFDLLSNSWQTDIRSSSEYFKRHSHSCVAVEENVVVITGGLNSDDNNFVDETCYLVDLRSNHFSRLKNMIKIYSHTSHFHDNKLYILGGISKFGSNNKLLTYDLRNECFIETLNFDIENDIMLHNHSSVLMNGKIYSIGGGGNCFSFGTHINDSILEVKLK